MFIPKYFWIAMAFLGVTFALDTPASALENKAITDAFLNLDLSLPIATLHVKTCGKVTGYETSNDPARATISTPTWSQTGYLGTPTTFGSELTWNFTQTEVFDYVSLTISKKGTDAWCIEKVWLEYRGATIWSHPSTEAKGENYIGPHSLKGKIWLDESDTAVPSVRFSDVMVVYAEAAPRAPLEVEFHTCAESVSAKGGTDDEVSVVLTRDLRTYFGEFAVETVSLDNAGNDRESNQIDRYRIDDVGISRLDKLTVRKLGKDAWCFDRVSVFVAGKRIFSSTNKVTLDGATASTYDEIKLTVGWAPLTQADPDGGGYPALPFTRSAAWTSPGKGARGQVCRPAVAQKLPGSAVLSYIDRCNDGLSCLNERCVKAGEAKQPCNESEPLLKWLPGGKLDISWSVSCDSKDLRCGDGLCNATGTEDGYCKPECSNDSCNPCGSGLACNSASVCEIAGGTGQLCFYGGGCNGDFVCGENLECVNPKTADFRWYAGYQGCRAGDDDCNVAAPKVRDQLDAAWDNGAMDWDNAQWNFNWNRNYLPSDRQPHNVFEEHVQGFTRTNRDEFRFVGSYSDCDGLNPGALFAKCQIDGGGNGGIFFVRRESDGYKKLAYLHTVRDRHPSGVAVLGKYVAFSDMSNEVRLIDMDHVAESTAPITFRAPGASRAGGGLGLAKLEGDGYLLVVSPSGDDEHEGQRWVRFYHLNGDLEHPVVKQVGNWPYSQPAAWQGDYRYTQNISVITERATGDIYVINSSTKGGEDSDVDDGYYLLSRVQQFKGQGLGLVPLRAYHQESDNYRCFHRAAATAWVNPSTGSIDLMCHERGATNGLVDGSDDTLRFKYGQGR